MSIATRNAILARRPGKRTFITRSNFAGAGAYVQKIILATGNIVHNHIVVRRVVLGLGLQVVTFIIHAFPPKLPMKLAEAVIITEFVPQLRNSVKSDDVGKFET